MFAAFANLPYILLPIMKKSKFPDFIKFRINF